MSGFEIGVLVNFILLSSVVLFAGWRLEQHESRIRQLECGGVSPSGKERGE